MRGQSSKQFAWARILACVVAVTAACEKDPASPTDEPPVIDAPALIQGLADAYQARDIARFASLLADAPEAGALFRFEITDDTGSTVSSWDRDAEIEIHRRMFRPNEIPAGDPQLDPKLLLGHIEARLTPQQDFVERSDLYQSASNPAGVDPARFRVLAAQYTTFVFFQPEGSQFVVDGSAEFVVVEELAKDASDPLRFRLLAWREPCPSATLASTECWSTVKLLYAK